VLTWVLPRRRLRFGQQIGQNRPVALPGYYQRRSERDPLWREAQVAAAAELGAPPP
jgi:hypothetical protein